MFKQDSETEEDDEPQLSPVKKMKFYEEEEEREPGIQSRYPQVLLDKDQVSIPTFYCTVHYMIPEDLLNSNGSVVF